MFLKTLTLKGFKSFADSTSLEMEPGVTVVVGPNGSGKSNVVDAIGWVLGAQAPSAVRSQKMDDVIFAGTATRPALGRAEVSLTIDNTAGLLSIDFTEVTITRTLWRSGDSEYAINGAPCRLLDVQELLSDSGVGRQQHVIISQGQIDAVLNAHPEERRLVIEEAAGVLKFRRRKEKAERRLSATEANLTRLNDLLREVRRQIRPLERQAHAARRHGDLVAELGALRLHLVGLELRRLRERSVAGDRTRQELRADEGDRRQTLARLDQAVLTTEARLSALGGDDLGDDLARCEALRERAKGLAAVLAERRRGLDRERGAQVDQTVIASLEAEAARLGDELAAVEDEATRLEPDAERLASAVAELAAERGAFDERWGDDVPAPTAEAAEARGELGSVRAAVERTASELERLRVRVVSLEAKLTRLTEEAARLRGEVDGAEGAKGSLVAALDAAEAELAAREESVATAENHHRGLDAEYHSWTARAEALDLALGEARARAGTERLADLDGVVGTLLDVIEIDAGWEAAFEAAAGAAIAAVVVDGVAVAREALDSLGGAGLSGSVVPLGAARPAVGGAAAVPGAERVRPHVRSARADVDTLLDLLVGEVAVVDAWPAAVDLGLAHPGATIVSRTGDRIAPDGWRIGSGGSGATGAALDEARERATSAAASAAAAAEDTTNARRDRDTSRRTVLDLTRQLDRNDSVRSAAGDALTRVEADRRDVVTETEGLQAHGMELNERLKRDRSRLDELETLLVGLEATERTAADQVREATEARVRLEERATAVGALRRDIEVRAAGIDERRTFLQGRRTEVEARLSSNQTAWAEAAVRRVDLDRQFAAVERLTSLVAERLALMERVVSELRERRLRQSEAARVVAMELDGLRAERTAVERILGGIRERVGRAEIDQAEIALRMETAVEALRREHDVEPDVAMATELPALPEGSSPPARVRELERELRLMGPVNPLALEELTALQDRNEHLEAQLEDVRSARRDLAKVIRAVDAEIVSVFATAYADVEANFRQLFETLFPGGRGRLTLNHPDDLLATGVEIEAKPSGKNVKKLTLLSGGERSLTALAYLFAVFRARPSPFYVMDEVEAALDDVNLHRFLGLVQEFRAEAQLLIVSHQKRTMEAADLLYGVTMAPGGSSQVLAESVSAGT